MCLNLGPDLFKASHSLLMLDLTFFKKRQCYIRLKEKKITKDISDIPIRHLWMCIIFHEILEYDKCAGMLHQRGKSFNITGAKPKKVPQTFQPDGEKMPRS